MAMLEVGKPVTTKVDPAIPCALQACSTTDRLATICQLYKRKERRRSCRIVPLVTLLAFACAPFDFVLLRIGYTGAAAASGFLGMVFAVVAVIEVLRLEKYRHSQLVEAERLHARAFRQASTSIWVEDWTEVGKVVLQLRQAGVSFQDYFAVHPDELHRLHRTVWITDVNDITVDFVGVRNKDALVGRLADIVPASAQTFERWLAALMRGDAFYRSESQIRRQDGSIRDCLVTAALPMKMDDFGCLLVTIVDITDYKADQARLAATDREAARASRALTMGALTAAIAHEVNNPLAAIVTNAGASLRWLRRAKPNLGEAEAAITEVIDDAMRARNIVDRTRRLVTEDPHSPIELDLVEAVYRVIPLVERDLRDAGVSLHVEAEPSMPRAIADAVQFQQILTNLLLNAAQAMTDMEGLREIRVHVCAHVEGICVEVSDSGPGVGPDRLGRLFDPFYSMREGGMGMGLAICKACVEAQGGRIWATSTPGNGASFGFTLPAAAPA